MNTRAIFDAAGGLNSYANSVCRMVETQEYAATTSLVDDLEEQAILEQILDEFKPNYAEQTQDLHYLISTPSISAAACGLIGVFKAYEFG